jgi:hypothetical protein
MHDLDSRTSVCVNSISREDQKEFSLFFNYDSQKFVNKSNYLEPVIFYSFLRKLYVVNTKDFLFVFVKKQNPATKLCNAIYDMNLPSRPTFDFKVYYTEKYKVAKF